MSFYVTLPSHSHGAEFPNNRANWFKIRLPHPLQLGGGQWQVGLSSISLPDAGVDIFQLVPRGHAVLKDAVCHEIWLFQHEDGRLEGRPFYCGWGDVHESVLEMAGSENDAIFWHVL